MALVRCKKCDKIYSTAAKSCPNCKPDKPGKPSNLVRQQHRKHARKSRRKAAWLAAAAITFVIGAAATAWIALPDHTLSTQDNYASIPDSSGDSGGKPGKPVPKVGENHRTAMTAAIAASVKNSLPDPNALVWQSISANDNASVVCLEYKVRNMTGEYQQAHFSYVNGKTSEDAEVWQRHCAGKALNDMAHLMDD
ncbi:MAG TPA: hypothetical protein VGU61_06425 [Noviherbaspirillum sp.]|jgi:phage FluMu protein Com|uniref:hypothetical protein n=1 Tax=Noviherbaspirillum sp. TaxID=1926288 RepID=UPI002DDD750F|nr:hypothetical protein [Noviherbaspirillum sp.]HEV2609884.1 hypothetical protein [Noviherbaspirillum sp.]